MFFAWESSPRQQIVLIAKAYLPRYLLAHFGWVSLTRFLAR